MKKYEKIDTYVYRNCRRYHVFANGRSWGIYDSSDEAVQVKNKLIQEGKIILQRRGRKPSCEEDRYIHKTKQGRYTIQKMKDRQLQHYGSYKTLQDARAERDLLESIGWNWELVDLI